MFIHLCLDRFVLCSFSVFAVCSLLLLSRPLRFPFLSASSYNLFFQALVYVSVSNRCLTWLSDHHGRRLCLVCCSLPKKKAWIDPPVILCSVVVVVTKEKEEEEEDERGGRRRRTNKKTEEEEEEEGAEEKRTQ